MNACRKTRYEPKTCDIELQLWVLHEKRKVFNRIKVFVNLTIVLTIYVTQPKFYYYKSDVKRNGRNRDRIITEVKIDFSHK